MQRPRPLKGERLQHLLPGLPTRLDDRVDLDLGNAPEFPKMLRGLLEARDISRPRLILRKILGRREKGTKLSEDADGLVRALGKVQLVLSGEEPVDESVQLLAPHPCKAPEIFVAGRCRLHPHELERIVPFLVPAQAVPKALQQGGEECLRLLRIVEDGKRVVPDAPDLLHGRGA